MLFNVSVGGTDVIQATFTNVMTYLFLYHVPKLDTARIQN